MNVKLLIPTIAAPTATPAIPASVIGVSTMRRSPNFSYKPLVTYSRAIIRIAFTLE